jgi:hypothetical protein
MDIFFHAFYWNCKAPNIIRPTVLCVCMTYGSQSHYIIIIIIIIIVNLVITFKQGI